MLRIGRVSADSALAAAGAGCCRSVIAFRNFTEAISRLSTIEVVFDCSTECTSSSGIATIRPNAVVFIATEIDADSRSARSAGLAFETAWNAWIRPMIVPSSPSSGEMKLSVPKRPSRRPRRD